MCNHDWIECGDEKICLLCGQVVRADEPAPSVTESRQKNRPINQVLHGNSLEVLKTLEDNSVDSIVTDPPYELGFMGKKWDSTGIAYNVELWKECLRVLKPGGHLLAFGGTRTQHRMVCAIEDAGFEIREQIQWIFGSGFPKSMNIGKAVKAYLKTGGSSPRNLRKSRMGDNYKPTGQVDYRKGRMFSSEIENDTTPEEIDNEWAGWGTCLKPAHEPICLARKPISEKTIAENVMKWGTGGLNIDGCRIPTDPTVDDPRLGGKGSWKTDKAAKNVYEGGYAGENIQSSALGRFPANVIIDEEAGKLLDEQSGITTNTRHMSYKRSGGEFINGIPSQPEKGWFKKETGGASRFFYCAKASKKERNMGLEDAEPTTVDDGRNKPIDNPFLRGKTLRQNTHPTVKPVKLMEYLITLVTPPNGIVLDPFFGSGTTGVAAVNLGFNYIGIELDEQYVEIARRRINAVGE